MLVGKSVPATRGFKTKLQYAINNAATVSGKDENFFFCKERYVYRKTSKENAEKSEMLFFVRIFPSAL